MKHDDLFERTNAASGCTSNDGDVIGAAIREQHRWGVRPPVLNQRFWDDEKCVFRPWSGVEEIERVRRHR